MKYGFIEGVVINTLVFDRHHYSFPDIVNGIFKRGNMVVFVFRDYDDCRIGPLLPF